MAVGIGKRKRDEDKIEPDDASDDEGAIRARFQQAFEAKFKPLQLKKPLKTEIISPGLDDKDDFGDSEWDGISEGDAAVEVINHGSIRSNDEEVQASEKKAFMSSKPPVSGSQNGHQNKQVVADSEEDSTEATNLKHDLALQRLLKESHLLNPTSFTEKMTAPEGKGRLKALDIRLRELGARESASHQDKMPFSQRKGISTKAANRDEKRRTEAAANGIVLEKAKTGVKSMTCRDRGVGGPVVGRFNNGTLKLNSRDLRSIEGPKQKTTQGRKGRR